MLENGGTERQHGTKQSVMIKTLVKDAGGCL